MTTRLVTYGGCGVLKENFITSCLNYVYMRKSNKRGADAKTYKLSILMVPGAGLEEGIYINSLHRYLPLGVHVGVHRNLRLVFTPLPEEGVIFRLCQFTHAALDFILPTTPSKAPPPK